MIVVISPQMRVGDQIWRQTTFSQLLNYHLQSLIHCLLTTINHSTRPVTKSSAQRCQRRSQLRWRDGLWRRGGDVVAGHRFNLIPVAGTCSYIKGWDLFLHRRRDLIQAICYCHWPAPFLAELFAKPPAKWHTMKAHWYCVQHTFSTPLPCQIFGKLWRVGLSTEC